MGAQRVPDRASPDATAGLDQAGAYRAAIAAFGDVASALGDIRDLDELLHLVARKICDLIGVSRCSIHLREEAGVYYGRVGHATKDIDAAVKRCRSGTAADGVTREILETHRPVIVTDARMDPRTVKSTVRYWNIRSLMAVPMILGGEIIGIVLLDDEDQPHAFSSTDQAIASAFGDLAAVAISDVQRTTQKDAQLQAAMRQVHALKRATALDERMTDLVLQGSDLQAIAETLGELMAKPCAIHDATGARLAVGSPQGVDDGIVPRLLEPRLAAHPEVAAALASCEGQRAKLVGPFLGAGLPHRFLVAPVTARGTRAGTLVVMEHLSRFNASDMFTTRRAATLVGLHMSMERSAAEAEWNAGASLATELIRGNADVSMVRRRAEHLGLCLHEPHRVCVISERTPGAGTRLGASAVREAFAEADAGLQAFATVVGDDVAVLVAEPVETTECFVDVLAETVATVCGRLSAGREVVGAISPTCRAVESYPEAFTAARRSVQCLMKFWTAQSRSVVSADDLGPSRLFLSAVDASEAGEFARASVGALLDEPSAANLLETLQVFFDQATNIRASAALLGVHENTIRYRLARVGQVTGLSVTTDPDAQISARLALLILGLQGRLSPRRVSHVPAVPEHADAHSLTALS